MKAEMRSRNDVYLSVNTIDCSVVYSVLVGVVANEYWKINDFHMVVRGLEFDEELENKDN